VSNWRAVVVRAARRSLDDGVPMMASAVAYGAFFAIPSVLLVVLGVFTLVSGPETVQAIVDKLAVVAPADVATLFGDSLTRLGEQPRAGVALTVVGLALAVWSATGAMSTVMAALNVAEGRRERRGFVRRRLLALLMAAAVGGAAVLAGLLLVAGPHVESWVGDALDAETAVALVWWIGQWPILVGALLLAFAIVLSYGPDAEAPRWRLLTPGSVAATVVWLAASAGFSLYTARFGSYDKTWGSLAAVIITLVWLWLAGAALLFGGELNAEAGRSRRSHGGDPDAARVPAEE
jgi:membrane protein